MVRRQQRGSESLTENGNNNKENGRMAGMVRSLIHSQWKLSLPFSLNRMIEIEI